jgi:hypothetical protein
MEVHTQQHCPKRKVYCPQNCGELIPSEEMGVHTLKICSSRVVPCGHAYEGCLETMYVI